MYFVSELVTYKLWPLYTSKVHCGLSVSSHPRQLILTTYVYPILCLQVVRVVYARETARAPRFWGGGSLWD